MGTKVFESQRDTQIVIDKKITIKKGDKVELVYLKDDKDTIVSSDIMLNDVKLINLDLEEAEQFLTIFLNEPI